jgi:hypothetical protein
MSLGDCRFETTATTELCIICLQNYRNWVWLFYCLFDFCAYVKASFLQKCMRSWDELGWVFQPKSHFTFALGLSSMVSIFKWSWSKIKTSAINIFIQLMSVYFDGWEAMCHFLSTMRETSSNGPNGSWHELHIS